MNSTATGTNANSTDTPALHTEQQLCTTCFLLTTLHITVNVQCSTVLIARRTSKIYRCLC